MDETDPGRKEKHEPRGERGREEENKEGRAREGERGKIGKGAGQTEGSKGRQGDGAECGRGRARDKGQEEGEVPEVLSSAFRVRAGSRSSGGRVWLHEDEYRNDPNIRGEPFLVGRAAAS